MLISKFRNDNIESAVQKIETCYNLVFPVEYRAFLLKYNGGRTPDTVFHIQNISSDIQAFYGLGEADSSHNISMIETADWFLNMINDKMFPVAINSFGDHVLIGMDEKNIGKIYFCYHDTPQTYIELTSNLSDFFSRCRSKKIGHIRTIEERITDMVRLGKENKITEEKLKYWQAEIDEYSHIKQEKVVLGI